MLMARGANSKAVWTHILLGDGEQVIVNVAIEGLVTIYLTTEKGKRGPNRGTLATVDAAMLSEQWGFWDMSPLGRAKAILDKVTEMVMAANMTRNVGRSLEADAKPPSPPSRTASAPPLTGQGHDVTGRNFHSPARPMQSDGSVRNALIQKLSLGFRTRGVMPAEADRIATDLAAQVVSELSQENWVPAPRFGDELLFKASNGDVQAREMIVARHSEGVSDDDIRWYWNLEEWQRRAEAKLEEADRTAYRLEGFELESRRNARASDATLAQAGDEYVRRGCPIYGNPAEPSNGQGDNRPLFPELMKRVGTYREKRRSADLRAFASDLEQSSSFNALIRKELRARRL